MVGVVFDGGHFLASNVRRLDLFGVPLPLSASSNGSGAIVNLGSWHLATPKLIETNVSF